MWRHGVDKYMFMSDGSVKVGQYEQEVAFFEPDGTVKDKRYGSVLGHVADDGTVKEGNRYGGKVLGVVASDGTVRSGSAHGQVMGHVGAPVYKRGALLLLLGY